MPKSSESMLYVKIATSTHRKARVRAIVEGITLCRLVEDALEQYLSSKAAVESMSKLEVP